MNKLFRHPLLALALALGLGSSLAAWAEPPAVASPRSDDGPQVLWKRSKAAVFRLRNGTVEKEERRGTFALALPGLAAEPLSLSPAPPAPARARFPLPPKILAVSDVHGRFDSLLTLLQAHKVVDAGLHWRFGKGHLVVVGDVMDRGAQVTEAYWFLRALEAPAQRAGGRVHLLLGNHEAMVMTGDWRYVNAKYLQAPEGWPSVAAQFGADSELGRWLRSRPVLLQLGPFLFLHGGLSPEFLARRLTLEQVNTEARAALEKTGRPEATGILGNSGPLWYRGLLPEGGAPQSTDAEIQAALEAYQGRAFVVGHTTLEHLGSFHGGRVYGIDAGLKDGQPGEAWLWEQNQVWRAKADGSLEALVP
jgi:hypothetical protein